MSLCVLKKRPTSNTVTNDMVTEPNPIKYPYATATCVNNPFELAQSAGEGMRDMGDQQARHMKGVATRHATTSLARENDASHADVSEQATAATRNADVQATHTHLLHPKQGTQNTVKTSDQSAQPSTSTLDRGTQQGIDTAVGSTHQYPQQTSSSSNTIQDFDIGQQVMAIEAIPPHVEDRRAQILEQDNEAWMRD